MNRDSVRHLTIATTLCQTSIRGASESFERADDGRKIAADHQRFLLRFYNLNNSPGRFAVLCSKKIDRFCSPARRKLGRKGSPHCATIFFLLAVICAAPCAAQSVDRAKLLEEIIALQNQLKNATDPVQ